jgi:hypothetical protein
MNQLKEFESHKESLKVAYYLVGVLELRLRVVIPATLGNSTGDVSEVQWFSELKLSEQGRSTLARARLQDPSFPQDFLPFSFWRYLLSSRNYGSLWIPRVHLAFPLIDDPKSHKTFLTIDKGMDSALRLRNNIAHYNLNHLGGLQHSQEKVLWLINAVGAPTV